METSQTIDPVQLQKQHSEYDRQLHTLASMPYLSPDEEIEETRLKKLKLHIKDQLQHLAPQSKAGPSPSV